MKGHVLLGLVGVCFTGCGTPVPQASALQHLDGVSPSLRATSASAARVADDWSHLGRLTQRANVPAVENQARVLGLDSNRLSSRAGTAGAYLRRVNTSRSPRAVKEYVNQLAQALSAEWWEGREAGWTARLLGPDPLLEHGGDVRDLARLEALTRRSASRAVTYATALRSLRRRDRRLFQYAPVGPTSSRGGTP